MSALNIPKFPIEDYKSIFNNIKTHLEKALEIECEDDFPQSIFDNK